MGVSVTAIITGLIVAGIVAVLVYFRKEMYEAGVYYGAGITALGKGWGEAWTGAFTLTPRIEPTVGLKLTGVLGELWQNIMGGKATTTGAYQSTTGGSYQTFQVKANGLATFSGIAPAQIRGGVW